MALNPIGHSVGQFLTVPSAVQGHERLHSSTYNQAVEFLFQDFKKSWQQRFFGVALLAINDSQRAWVRRQIDAAG
jgi:hypothetical protein